MQFLKDRGFILKRVNFGDSDRYITIFTKNHGKIEVIAKGVRRITSRRASSVELLNLIEFQSVRSRKNYVLTEVKLIDSFEELKKELLHIKKIVLVGCDADSWTRDLHRFQKREWKIILLGAVDLFPQTHHVEALAVLTRE